MQIIKKDKANTLKKMINNSYVFSVIAKIISVITGLIYSILFSRYLGSELRGEASIIINYATMISLVLCLGIYQAYPYFKKIYSKDIYLEYINYIFGIFILYLSIGLFVICVLKPDIRSILIIILSPILMAIKQLNYVVLIEKPKVRNTANIKLDIFDIVFLTTLLLFTKVSFFWCIVFLIFKYLVFFIIAIKNLGIKLSEFKPKLKGIFPYIKYGIIPMITVILMEVNYKIDVIMLERYNISTAEIGIYSLGVMLAEKLWMIPDALKDILLSKLAKGKTENEVSKISRISFWIMIIMILGMIVFGKKIINIMYGAEYQNAYFITLIILTGALGMVFYKMIYSYNVANGHKNVNLVLLALSAILNIIINAVLIPILNSKGAAIASLISYTICGISFLLYFCKNTNVKMLDMIFLKKEDFVQIFGLFRSKEK